jgi:hypothetical protein
MKTSAQKKEALNKLFESSHYCTLLGAAHYCEDRILEITGVKTLSEVDDSKLTRDQSKHVEDLDVLLSHIENAIRSLKDKCID